ncbi:MAG: HAMP domain-containing histidine kinase [Bacteroidales bacterium]|nr:HAMP domain-containing histidine kinase [Bacteroidales bacterium]
MGWYVKETAHQLGTPISSIMAWLELLKLKDIDQQIYTELEKDVDRLQIIANRFSKIGSLPVKDLHSVYEVVNNSVNYIKTRSSSNYQFLLEKPKIDIVVPINNSLFEWVVENICKNAIDAIGQKGSISIKISDNQKNVIVDISDTGKGIPRSRYKTVFRPGFTTKKRGWGLGLSLVKRIVEEYHQGKVFVLHSELNIGTTFRIILPKYDKPKIKV